MNERDTSRTPRRVPTDARDIVRPDRTALLVWDMQVGIAGPAYNLPNLQTSLSSLLAAARGSQMPIFWSRHVAPPFEYTTDAYLWTLMRRQGVTRVNELTPFMQRGSPETDFLPGTEPLTGELVIEKSTASFFIGTPLESRLRSRDIATVVLCGVATEQGVEFTARHAVALGFLTVIAEDATSSRSEEDHLRGLACLRSIALTLRTTELIAAWRATRNPPLA